MDINLLAFGIPSGAEWIIVGVVALLVFGSRLPQVARSMGRSIVEFKKGVRDIKDDLDTDAGLESKQTPKLNSTPESDSTNTPK